MQPINKLKHKQKKKKDGTWNRGNAKNSSARYRKKYPVKRSAHQAVYRARVKGLLIKPTKCSMCDIDGGIIFAHHKNYKKPLDVKWVCPDCHNQLHNIIKREGVEKI